MWPAVRDNFMAFSEPLEGKVLWMYADQLGLVSIGIGNLIDPVGLALALPSLGGPFSNKNDPGAAVNDADIQADWTAVKTSGARAPASESLTALRISEQGCKQLVLTKVDKFESGLLNDAVDPATGVKAFADFATWPADAQLGLLSMSWAMGPDFAGPDSAGKGRWPAFRAACASADWLAAAANCRIAGSYVSRNAVNRGLFRNAAWAVQQADFDAQVLFLPIGVTRPVLHQGDTDSGETTYVSDAQFFLSWLGYTVAQSGAFDSDTLTEVRQFQQDEGFPVTGNIGPLTWAALGYGVAPS